VTTAAHLTTRRPRTLLASLLTALLVVLVTAGLVPDRSHAHSGGKAIPSVTDFTLTPAGQGWTASVSVVDFDGGEPLEAVDVQLKGAGLAKYAPMTETARAGTYERALPEAEAGPVQLALRFRTLPGGTQITDADETYQRTLAAGQPLHVVGSQGAANSDGGGSGLGMILGGGAALAVALGVGAALLRRGRSTTPATTR
jgi:hypothetical protein